MDPADYPLVVERLRAAGGDPAGVDPDTRRRLAAKVFAHLAALDTAIAKAFDAGGGRR